MAGKTLNKTTLVLLPGLDGTGDLFANLVSELPEGMKVTARGYPAEHFLPYPDLVAWLGGVVPKNEPYVLLGESYGSPLSVMFAATYPPNLVGLILCVGFISNPVRNWGFLPKLLARPLFFQFQPPGFLLEYFIAGSGAPENLKLAVRRATRSVTPAVLAARARAVIDVDAREEIRQVKVPLLYMQASEDKLVSSECLDEIQRLHPETIVVSIRSPHLMLQRQPRVAAKAIVQFIDTQCRRKDLGARPSSSNT
jgi:pimeloyl-ACP methyl ester carboxylesterase